MTTQKLEEKILYNARGDIHSKLSAKIYEPIILFDKPAKEYSPYSILTAGKKYEPIPLLAINSKDTYLMRNGIYTKN
jgi:hypothetical protein